MSSGTISLGTSGNIQGRIKWSSSSNGTTANSSEVTATIQVKRTNSYTTTGTWTGSLTIDGTKKSYSKYKEVSDSYVTLYSFSKTVKHKDNGEGTCAISGVINGPSGTSQEDSKVSESKTVTLDTIARYAILKSVNNFTDEENPKITYDPGAGSALETLSIEITASGLTEEILKAVPKTSSSSTITLTADDKELLRKASSKSNTLTVTFSLKSKLSGTEYTSQKTAVMTIVNAEPTLSPTAVDQNETTKNITGDPSILVANYSQAKITVNAVTKKEASISKISVKNGTKTISGDGTISPVQNAKIVATVTDSRGKTATKELPNVMIPYASPSCIIEECLISGIGSMTLRVGGSFYNASIGKTKNTLTVQYRIKQQGGSYGNWTEMASTLSGNEYDAETKLTGLDYQKNHVIQVRASDVLATKTSPEMTVISVPVFDWGQEDFNFNVPVRFSHNGDSSNALYIDESRIKNLQDPQNPNDAVNRKYLEEKTAPPATLLWDGTWTSGKITVPDTDQFTGFKITVSGHGTAILVMKHNTHIRGVGGYPENNKSALTYHFAATFSGNEWTLVACNYMYHYPDGNHNTLTDCTVRTITGIF